MSRSTALDLEKGGYYRLLSLRHAFLIPGTCQKTALERGARVLVASFGKYLHTRGAFLLHVDEHGEQICLFYPVSRYNRGAAHWIRMNDMMVIAMADKLPVVDVE